MDTAKCAMAALGTGNSDLMELLNHHEPYPNSVPGIFVPTTHGTASEVTMWGTVWDPSNEKKYSLSHPDLYPKVAILDPHLTVSLPLDISLTTSLDALSHSFEAIWNKHANDSSTAHAVKAIALILDYAVQLKKETGNLELREQLLTAAATAGLAFSATRTAAAHSISYPLTIHFGIPHGIAASISLIPLLRINRPAIEPALETLYRDVAVTGLDQLMEGIRAIPEGILKYRLRDWGIQRDQLGWLVPQCFSKGRMDNNIVDLTHDQVRGILEEIY
jgi:alcohol dehydrogenase class IV